MSFLVYSSRREMWLNAITEVTEADKTPRIWMGDPKVFPEVETRFPDCFCISEVEWLRHGPPETHLRCTQFEYSDWSRTSHFLETRRVFGLLCTRMDSLGTLRQVDIEVLLQHTSIRLFALYKEFDIEHCIFAEAPHTPIPYLAYAISNYLSLKNVVFQCAGGFPVLLARDAIDSDKMFQVNKGTQLCSELEFAVTRYVERIQVASSHADFEPEYMHNQKAHDQSRNSQWHQRVVRSTREYLGRQLSSAPAASHHGVFFSGLDCPERFPIELLIEAVRLRRRKFLRTTFQQVTRWTPSADEKFVFFPLHYEPERTTVPDGGRFMSQFDALATLRKLVPVEIPIVVKEHYSQFSDMLSGHLGRSPLFYRATMELGNIRYAADSVDTFTLLHNALIVAVITGTAGLEAATLGTPTLVFGHPWYAGLPGATSWRQELSFDDLLSKPRGSRDETEKYLLNLFTKFGVPGVASPSHFNAHRHTLSPATWAEESHRVASVIRVGISRT